MTRKLDSGGRNTSVSALRAHAETTSRMAKTYGRTAVMMARDTSRSFERVRRNNEAALDLDRDVMRKQQLLEPLTRTLRRLIEVDLEPEAAPWLHVRHAS